MQLVLEYFLEDRAADFETCAKLAPNLRQFIKLNTNILYLIYKNSLIYKL
jgi:hypothetical protein